MSSQRVVAIWSRLKQSCRWSILKRAGSSRVLRSSYFWLFAVPLLAYLLSKTGSEIKIPIGESTFTITLGLPFSWKAFYFSSVAFAVASFIYSIRSPEIIRDYPGFPEFKDEGKGARQIAMALPHFGRPTDPSDQARRIAFGNRFALDPKDKGVYVNVHSLPDIVIDEAKLPEAFWWVREQADSTGLMSRIACSVFYMIGFSLILWVLWENFCYVLRAL